MKRKIIKSIAFLLLAVVAYGFLGPYGVHSEECIKCGAMRIQLRISTVPLMSYARETPVSAWYRTFDAHHTDHAWGAVSGSEHTWSNGWPGWSSYDNFGLTTASALRDLHDRRKTLPAEELARIMESYVSADVASITGRVWRLPEGTDVNTSLIETVPSR
jgi:hypothetical protein